MITILYGSESGNTRDYASMLATRLKYSSLKPKLAALDEYPLKKLITDTTHLIIVCSTAGQGQVPRNAVKFFNFIRKKKLPSDLLNHIKLTSFGVGDSSYNKFNHAIRKIHNRLIQLGCSELSPRCEADEMSPEGVDGYYTEWEASLLQNLSKDFPIVNLDDFTLLLPDNRLVVEEAAHQQIYNETLVYPNVNYGKIVANKRITAADHFQDVRHVIIESETLIKYSVGDSLALYPWNDDAVIDLLFQAQPHWLPYADLPITISGSPHLDSGLIKNLTLRTLFKYHLDIVAIPRRSFFTLLWRFCDSTSEDGKREQEKLKEFGSFEQPDELYNYANKPRRSILETILEFQGNVRIPLQYIFDLFPKIHPRLFSIASKPDDHKAELVIAIVEYKTILKRIRRGLCTKWLKQLPINSSIPFTVHASNLTFSNDPIIMIAPGTGIAPMKSLIEERASTNQELYLFYGCRFRDKDCLFDEKWKALHESKQIHYLPCFSRDPDSKYKYVQDKLFAEKDLVADLITKQNAIIFICGSSGQMPRQVKITLIEILKTTGLSEEEASQYILDMENTNRYIQETW